MRGLDPAWVASVVAVDGIRPSAVEFDGFVGAGQLSQLGRHRLAWPDGEGPESVVVKLPSADPTTRSRAFARQFYAKECNFYRSVLPEVGVASPRPWHVAYDAEAEDFAIVLDELRDSEPGDQFVDLSDDRLALAIDQAAILHAGSWNRFGHPAFEGYLDDVDRRAAMTAKAMPTMIAEVESRLSHQLDDGVLDLLERLVGCVGRWRRGVGAPVTLVHGDFRADNFLFGRTPTAPPIAVVDWQLMSAGLGTTDVAFVLGGSVDPTRRHEIEVDLLDRYRGELARHGVDVPARECWWDYVLGTLHGVVVAVVATSLADQTERGDALMALMLNRHAQHAIDLDAIAAVEG